MEVLSLGHGILILHNENYFSWSNPIYCDCVAGWLVVNPNFLSRVKVICNNGTKFQELDLDALKSCPAPCPYMCVSAQLYSLCRPGTEIFSKVDNCRHGELCCQPMMTTMKTTMMTTPRPAGMILLIYIDDHVPENWLHVSLPVSSETRCSRLADIEHGHFIIKSCPSIGMRIVDATLPEEVGKNNTECIKHGRYETGTVVEYECNQYYILKESRRRICKMNGQWSGRNQFCEPGCGKRVPLGLSAGGKPSVIGKWPWQAAIYDVKRELLICGGALIREDWVLTAAHCLAVDGTARPRPKEDFLVYLGKHYRNDSLDDEFVEKRKVSTVILHSGFNRYNLDSDIALLKLSHPVELTERVQLICLPTYQFLHFSETNLQNGNIGWVAGWGANGSDIPSDELTEIEIPVLSNANCHRETIKRKGKDSTRTLNWQSFCAGHDEKTSEGFQLVCSGDSGSPMVFYTQDLRQWQIEGIVSHYLSWEPCSMKRPGEYGIFTRVNRGLKVKSTKHMMRVERQRSQQRRKAHEGTSEVAPLHSKKLKTRQSASSGSSTAGSSEDILAAVDSDLHSSALSSRGPSVDADVRYSVFSSSKAASSSMSQGHPFARSSAGGSLPLMRHSPKSAGKTVAPGLPEPLIKLIVHIHETTRENHKLLKSLLEVIEKKPFDFGSHTEPPFSCPQLPVLDEEGLEKLELCLSDQDDREQMVGCTHLVMPLSRPE
ncbi:unnamed protein product, partial [Darwinula stevensoni]